MSLESGSQLGPYRIMSALGAGGMGEGYRALDTRLDREVAIKVLPDEWRADPERWRRFEQESKAVGALNHPNILAIYDVGSDRVQAALSALEAAPLRVVYPLMFSSAFFSHAMDHYVRAEVLTRLGRHEEALAWYEASHQQSAFDLVYLAPSLLRRAEIYEKLGRRDRAAEHYRRFVELWSGCDPELRPLVDRARTRLSGLGVRVSG